MSKNIKIAALGIAALATAAAPMMAMALVTGPHTDTINVTIDDNCQFTRKATAHTGGGDDGGAWSETGDVLTRTIVAGNKDEDMGSSHFNVVCNNTYGYQVTLATSALETEQGDSIAYSTSAVGTSTSGWNVTTDWTGASGSKIVSNENGLVYKKTSETTADGDDFNVTYAVGVVAGQPAGTYAADAVYTFAQLDSVGQPVVNPGA